MIQIISLLFKIVVFLSIFIISYKFLKRIRLKKELDKVDEQITISKELIINDKENYFYKKIHDRLSRNEENYFSYKKIEKRLKACGNPLRLNPAEYIVGKIAIALALFGALYIADMYFMGALAAIFGFFVIDLYCYYQDKGDMKKINFELANICDTIVIQVSAGVFMGTVLKELYLNATHKRLKKALSEMAAYINLSKKNDIGNALDLFAEHFNSIHIDSFVMAIKQSLETEQAKNILDDVAETIKDVNSVEIDSANSRISRTTGVLQFFIYIGILAIVIYAVAREITVSTTGLLN